MVQRSKQEGRRLGLRADGQQLLGSVAHSSLCGGVVHGSGCNQVSGLLEPMVLPERLQMAFSALDKFSFPVLEQLSALFPSQHFKNGKITNKTVLLLLLF